MAEVSSGDAAWSALSSVQIIRTYRMVPPRGDSGLPPYDERERPGSTPDRGGGEAGSARAGRERQSPGTGPDGRAGVGHGPGGGLDAPVADGALGAGDEAVHLGQLAPAEGAGADDGGDGGGPRRAGLLGLDHFLGLFPGQAQPAPDPVEADAEPEQDRGGDAFPLAQQREQHVLGPDVAVAELQGLPQRQLQDLLGPRGEGDVAGRRRAAEADDVLDVVPDRLGGDAEGAQDPGPHPLGLVEHAEQEVLRADVVVVQQARLLLGQDDDPAGPVGEALEHVTDATPRRPPVALPRGSPSSSLGGPEVPP